MQFTFDLMANAKVEDTYNQEFSKGVVEDKGTILGLDEKITTPYGTFSNVLKTRISQRLNLTLMKTNTSTEYRRN